MLRCPLCLQATFPIVSIILAIKPDRLRCSHCGAVVVQSEVALLVSHFAAYFVATAACLSALFSGTFFPVLGVVLAPLIGSALSLVFPLLPATVQPLPVSRRELRLRVVFLLLVILAGVLWSKGILFFE